MRNVVEENDKLEGQRVIAPQLLKELEHLEPGQCRLLVQNSPRYQVWALAEELLSKCRRSWSEDPARAEEFALLALEILDTFHFSGFRAQLLQDLRAQAWVYVGNCRRVRSDLSEALEAFRAAEGHLSLGTGDPLERAKFLDLKSSLFAAQRNYSGAREHLDAAIRAYRKASEGHLEGRALVKLGKFLRDTGDSEEAIRVTERATDLLDPEVEPELFFTVKKNLVLFLTDLGRTSEAQTLLPEVRDLARQYGTRLERLRLLWAEALLRQRLGQVELAEEALKQTREGFIAAGIGYDVAQVSLDLAALFLESGRTDKVRQLAVETMPVFVSRNVQRELLVAWQLFTEAAENEVANLSLVNEVAARIRKTEGSAPFGDS